jgi:CheY-like chemotaxis protein
MAFLPTYSPDLSRMVTTMPVGSNRPLPGSVKIAKPIVDLIVTSAFQKLQNRHSYRPSHRYTFVIITFHAIRYPTSNQHHQAEGTMHTVLTIDDDPQLRVLMVILLTKLDCLVLEAENGYDGQLLALQSRPDFTLVDIMMEGQDGYTTCQNLRAQGYTGRLILVSAKALEPDRFVMCGADGYVQKPITLSILRKHLFPQLLQ